ncbi:MAG: porin family protein [Fibrobacterota bacterium]
MKRLYSTALIMAAVAVMGGSAQAHGTDSRDTPHFGLKAGVNYSNVYDTKGEAFNADPKFGLAAGVFMAIPIGKYLGIQPEILFSQKGFQAKGTIPILGNTYEFTRTTDYIDVPILFSLKPIAFLTLLVGPQYSFLMKQKDVFTSATLSVEQAQEFKNDNIRTNIFCFLGGVDINLTHVVLGPRVGWDILNNNGDGTSTNPRYKNVWYQAALGYRF